MQTKYLLLKSSGRITAIHSVAHSTYKGVPSWYFLGDVEWTAEENNGRAATLKNHEIAPYAICYDSEHEAEGKTEVVAIMNEMNKYLATKGKWLKKAKWVGECLVSWMPKQPTGLAPL